MRNGSFKLTPKSIRFQLIYGLGLFLTLLLSFLIYIQSTDNNTYTRSRALSHASDGSMALASMVKVWVMSNDYAGLQEALGNFSAFHDIEFSTVIDMDGMVLAHSDKRLVGKYVADAFRISFLRKAYVDKDHNIEILRNGDYIDVVRVIPSGDKHIGFVHLRFDQTAAETQISKRGYQGLGFGILYLSVAILLLYLIVNTIIKHLDTLIKTMKKVHEGDKRIRASEEGAIELSIVSREFNRMLDGIESSELELQNTKEQLEYAINGTQDGLWDWDLQTNEIYFSARWKEMLGYTNDEMPSTLESWEKNVHPDDVEKTEEDIAFSHEKPDRFYENIHRLRHKNGSWVWILDRGQTIFNEEGKAIRMVGFHTDITKQKELEQELFEQEELVIAQSRQAAMGEMISMIAHQWRQPISVIAMGANNMLADIELEDVKIENFKDEAKDILKQTEFLSKTIDDFRTFFRPNKDKDKVRVVDVVFEAEQIMGKSLQNHNIELSIVDNSGETIQTYSRELLQVILNLLKNAKEAIESNNINSAYIKVSVESLDDFIIITVCDNGGGIDGAVLEHIFEPYFSTKEAKTGTGLGLYMSKTIIQKHLHGTLAATNTDEGSCFTATLPKTFNGDKTYE